jgi:hypothetical protein
MTSKLFTKKIIGRLAVLALLAIWVIWALPAAARADTPTVPAGAGGAVAASPFATPISTAVTQRGDIVEFGHDVTIAAGETAKSVTVFGADVTVAGTVLRNLTVIGGDATLAPTAVVGNDIKHGDVSLAVVGGHLNREAGAAVTGRTVNGLGDVHFDAVDTGFLSFFGGMARIIFLLFVTMIVVALAPTVLREARDVLAERPLPALGWGFAGFLVGVPVVTIALLITIIGIIILVPWLLFVVPVIGAAGVATAAYFVGRWILEKLGHNGERLFAATALGAVALCVVQFVPFFGCLALLLASVAGTGAVLMVIFKRYGDRRQARKAARAGGIGAPLGGQTIAPTPAS